MHECHADGVSATVFDKKDAAKGQSSKCADKQVVIELALIGKGMSSLM